MHMLSTMRSSNSISSFSAATIPARVVERELHDAPASRDRDRLDRDARIVVREAAAFRLDPLNELDRVLRAFLVLDPDVEVLRVFADDDQIHLFETRTDAWIGLARTDLTVEIEALAKRDVHGAEAASDRCCDRALEGDAGFANRVEDVVGQG